MNSEGSRERDKEITENRGQYHTTVRERRLREKKDGEGWRDHESCEDRK